MKLFMRNADSLLDNRFWGGRHYTQRRSCAALVPGYSLLSETGQQKIGNAGQDHRSMAILYADVSRGNGSYPEDICATCQCVSVAKAILRSCVFSFRGSLSGCSGEGIHATFEDVDSAMQCAINVQIALNKQNSCRKAARQLRYRIGVNTCEAGSQQAEREHRAIKLTTQLQRLTTSGGICVSQSARDNLRDKSKISFISLGRRYLPGCKEPVEALWIEMDQSRVLDIYQSASNGASVTCS